MKKNGLNQREYLRIKDQVLGIINFNCKTSSPEIAMGIAEEVCDELDKVLFSDLGEQKTEHEVYIEVSTAIATSLNKRGLEIREMGN